MSKIGSALSLFAACLILTVFGGCGDSDADFRPSEENTPQIPTNDVRGTPGEDNQQALDNLK